MHNRRRWARGFLIASCVLAAWAAVIALTGGFRIELGPVRISSRNAVRVALLALVPALLAWRLAYRERLDTLVSHAIPALRRGSVAIALAAAATVLALGVKYGVRAAGGSDVFGYVSQSALWMHGTLRIDQTFAASMPWPEAKQTFAPLGYRIGAGEAMVPTYAPGLPLLMAAGRLASPCGPYLIGPVCGALLVLFTFQLGRRVFGTATATAASVLVACSPVVLFMSFSPMADVPAATFWTGALAAAASGGSRGALLAGVLTGIAVLIRPNLVPLAIFPWIMSIVKCDSVRPVVTRAALFALGSVPGALFIAWTNNLLYGSPLRSGYGDLGPGFALKHAVTNLEHYAAWWWETQGAAGFLFVAALLRPALSLSNGRRERAHREFIVLVGFALSLTLLYLFYRPFETWLFLRFLLPAIPIVFLLCADLVNGAAGGDAGNRFVALAALAIVAAAPAIRFADVNDITTLGAKEERNVEPALHVAAATPPDAVILAFQHSGNIRYYTGRLTLRWDMLDPAWLDRAVETLHQRGVQTFLLTESWEEAQFRERFKGQRLPAALDRGPLATARGGEIRFYSFDGADEKTPVDISVMTDRPCLDMSSDFIAPRAIVRLR